MSGELQVIPLCDLIEHDLNDTCVCGPRAELVTTERGDEWMFVHHSLDGREAKEARRG